MSYWLSEKDDEVDFLVGDYICGIEAKGVSRLRDEHFRGLKPLAQEHPEVKQRVLVIYEGDALRREDGIRVLNHRDFIKELWAGNLF